MRPPIIERPATELLAEEIELRRHIQRVAPHSAASFPTAGARPATIASLTRTERNIGSPTCSAGTNARHLFLDVRPRARAALPHVHFLCRLARHSRSRHRAAGRTGDHRSVAGFAAARIRSRARLEEPSNSTRPSAMISPATIAAFTKTAANGRSAELDARRAIRSACSGPQKAISRPLTPGSTHIWRPIRHRCGTSSTGHPVAAAPIGIRSWNMAHEPRTLRPPLQQLHVEGADPAL